MQKLSALLPANSAGIRIIGSAHWYRHRTGLGNNRSLRRGRGDLSGGNCTGENEGDDGCTDSEFHMTSPKVVFTVERFLWTRQIKRQ